MRSTKFAFTRPVALVGLIAASLSSCVRPAATSTDAPVPAAAADTTGVARREPARATGVESAVLHGMPHRSAEEAAVMKTVIRLFDGMRAGDSSMVRAAFDSNPRLVTTMVRNGVPVLTRGSVDDFVKAVGTPHSEVWDERISGEIVHIDGPLATVWMRYSFYAGSTFSHCGVNAFELFRRPDGWRITSIADTRRRDRCDE